MSACRLSSHVSFGSRLATPTSFGFAILHALEIPVIQFDFSQPEFVFEKSGCCCRYELRSL